MTETPMTAESPKPWWASLTSWGIISLAVAYVAADRFGYSLDGLVGEVSNAVMIVSTLFALIGNATRHREIDPKMVLPGLKSESFGKAIAAIDSIKRTIGGTK